MHFLLVAVCPGLRCAGKYPFYTGEDGGEEQAGGVLGFEDFGGEGGGGGGAAVEEEDGVGVGGCGRDDMWGVGGHGGDERVVVMRRRVSNGIEKRRK